jgi:hypothetical protein
MPMRTCILLLAGLFCVALAGGCGGESDKKGINKDRDKPVPQSKAPAGGPGPRAERDARGRL